MKKGNTTRCCQQGIVLGQSCYNRSINIYLDNVSHSYTRCRVEITFGLELNLNKATHVKIHMLDYIVSKKSEQAKATFLSMICLYDHYMLQCDLSLRNPLQQKPVLKYHDSSKLNINASRSDITNPSLIQNCDELDLEQRLKSYENRLTDILNIMSLSLTVTPTNVTSSGKSIRS